METNRHVFPNLIRDDVAIQRGMQQLQGRSRGFTRRQMNIFLFDCFGRSPTEVEFWVCNNFKPSHPWNDPRLCVLDSDGIKFKEKCLEFQIQTIGMVAHVMYGMDRDVAIVGARTTCVFTNLCPYGKMGHHLNHAPLPLSLLTRMLFILHTNLQICPQTCFIVGQKIYGPFSK